MGFLNSLASGAGKIVGRIGRLPGEFVRNLPTALTQVRSNLAQAIPQQIQGIKNIGSSFAQGYSEGFNPPQKPNPLLSTSAYTLTPAYQQSAPVVTQPAPAPQPAQAPIQQQIPIQAPIVPSPLSISPVGTPSTIDLAQAQQPKTPLENFVDSLKVNTDNINNLVTKVMGQSAISPEVQTTQTRLNELTKQIQGLTNQAQSDVEAIQSQPGELASIAEARAQVYSNQFRKNIQPLVDEATRLQENIKFQQQSANDLLTRQIAAGNLAVNVAQLPIQQLTALSKIQEATRGEVVGSPITDNAGNVSVIMRNPNGTFTVNQLGQFGKTKTNLSALGRVIPAETVATISSAQNLLDITNNLSNLLSMGVSTGPVAAPIAGIRGFTGIINPLQEEARAQFQRLNSLYTYLISGKQVTDIERQALRNSLPLFSAQESVNKVRLKEFGTHISGIVNRLMGNLGAAGYRPFDVNAANPLFSQARGLTTEDMQFILDVLSEE
jgi:hypothetical protein